MREPAEQVVHIFFFLSLVIFVFVVVVDAINAIGLQASKRD